MPKLCINPQSRLNSCSYPKCPNSSASASSWGLLPLLLALEALLSITGCVASTVVGSPLISDISSLSLQYYINSLMNRKPAKGKHDIKLGSAELLMDSSTAHTGCHGREPCSPSQPRDKNPGLSCPAPVELGLQKLLSGTTYHWTIDRYTVPIPCRSTRILG
jgi:hypothetical protein